MEKDQIIIFIMDFLLVLYSLILYIYNKCYMKKDYLNYKTFADNSKNLFKNDMNINLSLSEQKSFNQNDDNSQLENLI